VEVVVWAGGLVNGVQAIYKVGGERIAGPIHRGGHGTFHEHRLALEAGEEITRVEVAAGGVVDALTFVTSKGRQVRFGGKGGDCHVLETPHGMEVVGFFGGIGGHLHNLGIITGPVAARQGKDESPVKCPWGVYTSSPVFTAARDLALGPKGKDAAIQALVGLLSTCPN